MKVIIIPAAREEPVRVVENGLVGYASIKALLSASSIDQEPIPGRPDAQALLACRLECLGLPLNERARRLLSPSWNPCSDTDWIRGDVAVSGVAGDDPRDCPEDLAAKILAYDETPEVVSIAPIVSADLWRRALEHAGVTAVTINDDATAGVEDKDLAIRQLVQYTLVAWMEAAMVAPSNAQTLRGSICDRVGQLADEALDRPRRELAIGLVADLRAIANNIDPARRR